MEITRGMIQRALKVVIYGPEGIGKTTFASHFPAPLFIDTENSTDFIDVARFPKPSSWTMLLEEVNSAKRYIGQYLTLVIDTGDWAEMLCKKHILASRSMTSIEDAGYGKGYVYLAEEWGKLLNALTELRDAGMNVVLTAHAMMRKFEQPDELGAYDRWELKLEKKTAPMTKEWADMILFANYETYIIKETKGAAKGKAQGGKRVMYTTHHPCWDAKNRQGLADKLPFEFEQIAGCFQSAAPTATPPEVKVTPPAELAKAQGVPPALDDDTEEPAPAVKAPAAEAPEEKSSIPKAVSDLMQESNVTEDEIRAVITERGYFPFDAEWTVMEQAGFVDGWIVPCWKTIVQTIESKRAH